MHSSRCVHTFQGQTPSRSFQSRNSVTLLLSVPLHTWGLLDVPCVDFIQVFVWHSINISVHFLVGTQVYNVFVYLLLCSGGENIIRDWLIVFYQIHLSLFALNSVVAILIEIHIVGCGAVCSKTSACSCYLMLFFIRSIKVIVFCEIFKLVNLIYFFFHHFQFFPIQSYVSLIFSVFLWCSHNICFRFMFPKPNQFSRTNAEIWQMISSFQKQKSNSDRVNYSISLFLFHHLCSMKAIYIFIYIYIHISIHYSPFDYFILWENTIKSPTWSRWWYHAITI